MGDDDEDALAHTSPLSLAGTRARFSQNASRAAMSLRMFPTITRPSNGANTCDTTEMARLYWPSGNGPDSRRSNGSTFLRARPALLSQMLRGEVLPSKPVCSRVM